MRCSLERVEGETLRARLKAGADWRTLLEPFAQVADALAKAHAAGIVHRDLKPENVMLTPDGYPKVLDFGLAKLVEREAPDRTDATETIEGRTKSGVIVGTPGYMSPEQVQGKPLDHRSDIFSFGSMLYEAVTRRRPFSGDSTIATLHAIVYEEATPIESLNPDAPQDLVALIRRCLVKGAEQRCASIRDVANDLKALARNNVTSSRGAVPTAGDTAFPLTQPGSRSFRLVKGTLGVVFVAILVLGLVPISWWRDTPLPSAPPSLRIEKVTNRGDASTPAISQNGRYLAYAAGSDREWSFWLRDLVEKGERLIAGPFDAANAWIDFANDGHTIYYSLNPAGAAEHTLYRVALIGGEPQLVRRDASTPTFSPDWKRVARHQAGKNEFRIKVSRIDGSNETDLGVVGAYWSAWLPDSSRLLFDRERDGQHFLYVISADGSGERKVADIPRGYRPDLEAIRPAGRVVACWFAKDGAQRLYAVDVTTGSQAPIGNITWQETHGFTWLPDGRGFVAVEWERNTRQWQMWFGTYPEGRLRRIPADTTGFHSLSLTDDGAKLFAVQTVRRSDVLVSTNAGREPFRKVAGAIDADQSLCWTRDDRIVLSSNEAGSYDLYLIDSDGSNRRQLTFDRAHNEMDPTASADGRYIVYVADGPDGGIFRMNRDGASALRLTAPPAPGSRADRAPRITPDSRFVLYNRWDNGPTLWRIAIDGGAPNLVIGARPPVPPALVESAFGASESPDGSSLGFFHFTMNPTTGEFSELGLAIATAEGRVIRRIAHDSPAYVGDSLRVRWDTTGDAVYYQSLETEPRNLWKTTLAGGAPIQVTDFEEGIGDFDFSFDGRLLACTRRAEISDIVMITNFR